MGLVWTSRPGHSITLCIIFGTCLPILTTNILITSCDATVFKGSNTDSSWDPTEELDYMNPSDIDAYSSFGSSLQLAPESASAPANSLSISAQPASAPNSLSISAQPPASSPTTSTSIPEYAPNRKGHSRFVVWCVARPTVPEPMLQKAMDYACGFGADCKDILPNGSCFTPNSLFAHASYAFNNYWQRTKNSGGTCDFGGTAMLITVDPSFDGCQFNYN